MVQELKHIFEGTLRGFTTEDRTARDNSKFKVDIMVMDVGLETYRITMRRADADDIKQTLKPGDKLVVETVLRGFVSGIGISFSQLVPFPTKK